MTGVASGSNANFKPIQPKTPKFTRNFSFEIRRVVPNLHSSPRSEEEGIKKKRKMRVILSVFYSFSITCISTRRSDIQRGKKKKKRKNVRCNFTIPKVTRAAPASVNNATPAVPIHAYRYEGSINIYVVAREILISLAIRCIPRWEEPLQSTSFLREVFPKRSPPFRDSLLSSFLIVPPLSFFFSLFFRPFVPQACWKKCPCDSSKWSGLSFSPCASIAICSSSPPIDDDFTSARHSFGLWT